MLAKGLSDDFTPDSSQTTSADSEALLGNLNIQSTNLGSPDGHGSRVAIYSLATGKRLDLSEKALADLKSAAALHDIGKVGISRQIVDKIGKLSDHEFEIMRLHSTIAIRMLERVEGLKDSLPMIKHHHERFDGKGYPDKLKGHDIPIGARIIAVAETFDILVSDVPWRNALLIDEAVEELRANAGTQFDPMVVEAFVSALKANEVELPEEVEDQLQTIRRRKTN